MPKTLGNHALHSWAQMPKGLGKSGHCGLQVRYIMQQKPFTVVLVNNKVWKVSGNPCVLEKPSAIYIQAADGQILGIYSNK